MITFDKIIAVLMVWILTIAALGMTIGVFKYLTKPNVAVVAK